MRFEAQRHRALAKILENPLLRADHIAVAEAIEEFLEVKDEKEAIREAFDEYRI